MRTLIRLRMFICSLFRLPNFAGIRPYSWPVSCPPSISENGSAFSGTVTCLSLTLRVWVDYGAVKKQMNVTLAPSQALKPQNLFCFDGRSFAIYKDTIYIGFSSSIGSVISNHYVLGWSFEFNGQA
ncbi:hypothetical protein G4B88_029231 [Cannabis sativa]|uniref:Legume lectin domain-containing protein n=1 Tax=Cannabis sativa TaxID=3483 RepID=A0A7J6E1H0_CANSA|nr:hypothetical protein G4B88_029231 [Cannabis sativa]